MELEFLDSAPAEDVVASEVQAEVQPEQSEGPARGPDGKFVAKDAGEAQPEPQPQPQAPPAAEPSPAPQATAEPRPEPGHVPLSVLLDEREKRQALEGQLRAIQQHFAQQQHPEPDPEEDLAAWINHQQAQTRQSVVQAKVQLSEDIAIERFGEELVRAADKWALGKAQQMPGFYEHVISQRNPYGYLVQEYQRETALTKLSDPADVDQFLAWRAAQAAAQAQPAVSAATPPQAAPPRSIASLPSAGAAKPGEQPVGPGVAFDAIFMR